MRYASLLMVMIAALSILVTGAQARPAQIRTGVGYQFKTGQLDIVVTAPDSVSSASVMFQGQINPMRFYRRQDSLITWIYRSPVRFKANKCYSYALILSSDFDRQVFSAARRANQAGLSYPCKPAVRETLTTE